MRFSESTGFSVEGLSSTQVSFDIDKDQDSWETEGTGDVVGRTLMKMSQETE